MGSSRTACCSLSSGASGRSTTPTRRCSMRRREAHDLYRIWCVAGPPGGGKKEAQAGEREGLEPPIKECGSVTSSKQHPSPPCESAEAEAKRKEAEKFIQAWRQWRA